MTAVQIRTSNGKKFSTLLIILAVLCLVIKALQCFSFSIYCNFTCKKNTLIGQQWKNSFVSASFRIVEFWFATEYLGLIKSTIRNTENYFILHNLNYPTTTKKYSLQENSPTSYKTKPLSRKITQPENSTSSVKSEKWESLRREVHTNLQTQTSNSFSMSNLITFASFLLVIFDCCMF